MSTSDTPKDLALRCDASLSARRHALTARARRDLGLVTRRIGVQGDGTREVLSQLLREGLVARQNGVLLVPLRAQADVRAACAARAIDCLVTSDCDAPSQNDVPTLVLFFGGADSRWQLPRLWASRASLVMWDSPSPLGSASGLEPVAALVRTLMEMTTPRATLPAGSCVLWADDNCGILESCACLLEGWGIELIPARDASEATDLVRAHADRIDVIVSDYCMPGADGPEFFNAIAPQVSGRIPLVIEATGEGQIPWWLDALSPEARYAVHGMASAPFEFDELWTMLERCLRIRLAMQRAHPLGGAP